MKIVSSKYKRRFAIGDIHGCKETLAELIYRIDLQPNDALFFLGDYIDRGPDSSGVLDLIISLQENNFNIFPLRGNHEQSLLEAYFNYELDFFRKYVKTVLKSDDLLKKSGKIKKKYKKFIKNTQFYYELEDFFLVHAGFDFSKKDYLSDKSSLLNIRRWDFDINKTNGKRVIHGHQPTNLEIIKLALVNNNSRIPLDNGCVYTKKHKFYDYSKLGQLCCLNLDTFELICQKNIE